MPRSLNGLNVSAVNPNIEQTAFLSLGRPFAMSWIVGYRVMS